MKGRISYRQWEKMFVPAKSRSRKTYATTTTMPRSNSIGWWIVGALVVSSVLASVLHVNPMTAIICMSIGALMHLAYLRSR
jgi:hypothetical protein